MRAARLLQILLILQNRGRQTSVQLGEELEVAPRTILRDVDAMSEAGLPIIVHQGNRGGIELGFNYRTRLTGLAKEEAQALGLILGAANPMIATLGLSQPAAQARAKLVESLPDKTRDHVAAMMAQFKLVADDPVDDPRIRALGLAIQAQTEVRIRFASRSEQLIHPVVLEMRGPQWRVRDGSTDSWIAMTDWGRINISAKRFASAKVD
ncbi:helix-turn-helix transcriptional regulator [Jannaschia sp. CCS1]|uniref:helix-turn-helix transcriptional regulator n=1 Tax=Jannaschia sp. (strain CCS1) TaxID=290400 RepID=UPI000053D96E|nr:HTH domain-containing protein [Jannaschia sp. CCS1]ABD55221.1 Helix-turn-helix type 11 [Jannaschia sp. CCS1]